MIYQDGEVLRKVACDGRFTYKGARYEAGRGLAGQKVAVDEVDDVLEVRYGEMTIAKYVLRPKRNIKISRCND